MEKRSVTVALLFGLVCATLLDDALTSPVQPQEENIVLNSKFFSKSPEYVEALAKELEKERLEEPMRWWTLFKQMLMSKPNHEKDVFKRNLDSIGGGNLLRRDLGNVELDGNSMGSRINGASRTRRRHVYHGGGGSSLDSIGNGNLVRRDTLVLNNDDDDDDDDEQNFFDF
ncbi:uncharacterized protein LOC106639522 isoform X2 [Copidosoma floridanum]|uniref:uncharacterized protein LOC106639522 isoform X2 n=1 Tax=Copidosoma floridanum TaxID=29053 RepID=UPI0006C989D1|nr:uncharacterized protein LOC106639522 isoform X2 [Copidosoma floridanum]